MAEQRLVDANAVKESLLSFYPFVKEMTKTIYDNGEVLTAYEVADMIEDCIEKAPTIDPETLPIVRQLREELANMTAERDAAVRDMHHNTKCFICAHLPADGNMSHCKHYAACGLGYIHWKWRGLQKEE